MFDLGCYIYRVQKNHFSLQVLQTVDWVFLWVFSAHWSKATDCTCRTLHNWGESQIKSRTRFMTQNGIIAQVKYNIIGPASHAISYNSIVLYYHCTGQHALGAYDECLKRLIHLATTSKLSGMSLKLIKRNISNQHKRRRNPNWQEADQLVIYKALTRIWIWGYQEINPGSGRARPWTRNLQISSPAP